MSLCAGSNWRRHVLFLIALLLLLEVLEQSNGSRVVLRRRSAEEWAAEAEKVANSTEDRKLRMKGVRTNSSIYRRDHFDKFLRHERINELTQYVDYGGTHPYEIMERRRRRRRNAGMSLQSNMISNEKEFDDRYEPIRIKVIADQLDAVAEADPSRVEKIEFLRDDLLPWLQHLWSSALRVVPAVRFQVTDPCELGYPGGIVDNADLVAFVTVDPPEFCAVDEAADQRVLAAAVACTFDQFFRPIVGSAFICTDPIDVASEDGRNKAKVTAAHEFAHILGFTSFFFPLFIDRLTGLPRTESLDLVSVECVDGERRLEILPDKGTLELGTNSRGAKYYEVVTPTVRTVVQNHFNCERARGARLENQPTAEGECFGSHWERRLFATEFMVAVIGGHDQIFSPLTLAFLEDSGWYLANFSTSSISPFGHGSGCDFVFGDCIVGGEVPRYGQGVFCTEAQQRGCDPSHAQIATCAISAYPGDLPDPYQYFSDPKIGGAPSVMDYCPTYFETSYGVVRDGSLDSLEFDCRYSSATFDRSFFDFEAIGPESRCFETDTATPLCLHRECDVKQHAVVLHLGNQSFTCSFDGQQIAVPFWDGSVFCPRLAEICPDLVCPANCSGRGRCDYGLQNPECRCFDPSDPSPSCENSPILETSAFPTHAPTTESPSLVPSAAPSARPTTAEPSNIPTTSPPSFVPVFAPSFEPSLSLNEVADESAKSGAEGDGTSGAPSILVCSLRRLISLGLVGVLFSW